MQRTLSTIYNPDLATKQDITSFKSEIIEIKAEILKWMFGALAGQTALLIAVIKLL